MTLQWSYDLLKRKAMQGVSSDDLEFLKELFSNEIGTPRRMDRIKTIYDLIDCLERNDELSGENVEPFRHFFKNNLQLQEAWNGYQREEIYKEGVNWYREQRLAEQMQQQLNISPQRIGRPDTLPQDYVTTAQITDAKRSAIFEKLSQELGRSWRHLGRQLHISEGTMDDIETCYPNDLKSRILKLLMTFEEDECNDPRQFLIQLCRGLADCGRNDLRRRVEQIMSH